VALKTTVFVTVVLPTPQPTLVSEGGVADEAQILRSVVCSASATVFVSAAADATVLYVRRRRLSAAADHHQERHDPKSS
jgi:hypothetical protein